MECKLVSEEEFLKFTRKLYRSPEWKNIYGGYRYFFFDFSYLVTWEPKTIKVGRHEIQLSPGEFYGSVNDLLKIFTPNNEGNLRFIFHFNSIRNSIEFLCKNGFLSKNIVHKKMVLSLVSTKFIESQV